jgi:hypothetical protein
MQINATTNYDLFTLLDYNRPCNDISQLERNILQCNKLEMSPIIVDKNFNIIDGQHRYLVAKKNNLILYYRIDPNASCENDIITYNKASKTWTIDDYVHFYSMKGDKAAIFIKKMIQEHPLTCNEFIRLFVKHDKSMGASRYVKDGKITLNRNEQEIENILSNLKEVIDFLKTKFNQEAFSIQKYTLITIMTNKQYDHVHFMSQINKFGGELSNAVANFRDKTQFRNRIISFVYNRSVKNEKKKFKDQY